MKIFKSVFMLLFLFVTQFGLSQLTWSSSKDKIIIPFEFTNNLIIIKVKINNIDLEMIVDTGAANNILFNFPEKDSITFYQTKPIQIKGLGSGENLEAIQSQNNQFKIKGLYDKNFEVLLLLNTHISIVNKLGLPVNGILGYSFFKNYLIEINYAKRKLYLYKKKTKFYKKRAKYYDNIPIELLSSKPYVKIPVDDNQQKLETTLLFDTGLSDGLWLFEDEIISCKNIFFEDILGVGLGGNVTGKKARVNKLELAHYSLEKALVAYPDSISLQNIFIHSKNIRNGSIGGEILRRFNWVLDYTNKMFYFRKNSSFKDPFLYNMAGIEIRHDGVEWVTEVSRTTDQSTYKDVDATEFVYNNPNLKNVYKYVLKPVFVIYSLRANSPAARAGLQINDIIISINKKKAYYYTIEKIAKLWQSEAGKTIKIEVKRNDKILKFQFQLEEII